MKHITFRLKENFETLNKKTNELFKRFIFVKITKEEMGPL